MKIIKSFNNFYKDFLKDYDNELVISENDLTKMMLDNSIIVEDIFRTDEFIGIFNFILNSKEKDFIFSPREISEYFPVKSKIRKKLLKPYFNRPLYVSIIDENSIDEIENSINYWTNLNEDNEEFCKIVSEVYNSFSDASALFYTVEDEKGVLFLRKDDLDIEDFKHEFIHYYKWVLKDDSNLEIDEDDIFKKYGKRLSKFMEIFDLQEDDIEYFCELDEFETLLNDAIASLLKIKVEQYPEMSKNLFCDLVFSTFFYNKKIKTVAQYFDKLLDSKLINDIKNINSLQFIIFNVLIGYNINRMKSHIFSELTNKKGFIFK